MSSSEILKKNLTESRQILSLLEKDAAFLDSFDSAAWVILQSYQAGGRLYLAGNGGSAADAQHLAAEFVSRLARDRAPLPAEALTTDTSVLTAIGNDYGFENVFARQIRAKVKAGDIFLAITTSGESPNMVKALQECRRRGIGTVLFSGRTGGRAATWADHSILVPAGRTSSIQEIHILLAHSLCEFVEQQVFFG